VQIPIESQRAFNASHRAGEADTTQARLRHTTSQFASAVGSLPEGFRTLFASPALGAQFQYARGDYASASTAIATLPTGSHDREILMLRSEGGAPTPISHRCAPFLASPTAGADRAEIPRVAEPRFCPGPPLPIWTRPPMGLSAAGWTALLDTRRTEARSWTDWLHQSAWARQPSPEGRSSEHSHPPPMPGGNLLSIWCEELYCSHSTPSRGAVCLTQTPTRSAQARYGVVSRTPIADRGSLRTRPACTTTCSVVTLCLKMTQCSIR
jgi:hypothetical protein